MFPDTEFANKSPIFCLPKRSDKTAKRLLVGAQIFDGSLLQIFSKHKQSLIA